MIDIRSLFWVALVLTPAVAIFWRSLP